MDVRAAPRRFRVASPGFGEADAINARHGREGGNVSPELSWSAPPEGTHSFAVLLSSYGRIRPDDLLRGAEPVATHWLGWGIDGWTRALAEGATTPVVGRNDFASTGYHGPDPAATGCRAGTYLLTLLALDGEVRLPEPGARRPALDLAVAGHVLGTSSLVGRSGRPRRAG
jgi:phosphatidylethanolamine-binding protein (PEBP) family uncharacterized protein